MKKAELLAPAGNMEKFKMALHYGADAVFLGGKMFNLRAGSNNFSDEELEEAVIYAHERGKRVYVTLNITRIITNNVIKNSSLLGRFLNDKKLTFAANSLNSFHSDTAKFARLTCFNFSSKI